MKYLKKFATAEEYAAFVESGQMKRPNVSLVEEPFTTYYNKYIPLGVFVQHVDGTLYTEDDWTSGGFSKDAANGVAVVTDNAMFVIAKTDVERVAWSSSTFNAVDGIMLTEDKATALTDFAGYNNTQLMLDTDTSGAGYLCANFSFPNGDKGYLPALGELQEAYANKSKIDSLMTTIGGSKLQSNYYWSSTQSASSQSWTFGWPYNDPHIEYKNTSCYARAFLALSL